MSDQDPYHRLNKMLARERLKLWFGLASLVLLAILLAVVLFPTPQSLGDDWADVVASSAAVSDDSAARDLTLRMKDGTRRRLRVSLITGITAGDRICVTVLRNPVTGGEQVKQVPVSRCP